MLKQHLRILGLNENQKPTKEEIKQAYKQLILKYHPDKSQSNSKEDLAKFYEIKQAYDFLMAHNGNDVFNDIDDSKLNAMWNDMFDMLVSQMTKSMKKQQKRSKKAKQHHCVQKSLIEIDMHVTLDELYHAKVKKLLVKVKNVDGTLSQEELYISLFSYKKNYLFENKGDYLEDGSRGDIMVSVKIDKHDCVIAYNDDLMFPYDLYIDYDISLSEYYLRDYMAIMYFGEVLEIENINPSAKCHVLHNKGLPYYDKEEDVDKRGDLYIYFNLVLPKYDKENMSDDFKTFLRKHFCL